ncbi:NAD(P)-dependent oxidoreductase [bacterium]|nr:NAD(P)-dependent oxidoreductase [bacterium]
MKLLLSGITGYVGGNVARTFRDAWHTVHGLVRDEAGEALCLDMGLTPHRLDGNAARLPELFERERFDGVIHLAACSRAEHTYADISELIDTNVLFGTRLLESCVRSGTRWFVNTGTFWQHYRNENYSPVNLYAATKQAFEDVARYYWEAADLNFATLVLFDTYGPDDPRPKLLKRLLEIAGTDEQQDLTPGDQLVDLVHVDDVAAGYLRLAECLHEDETREFKGRTFALSSGSRRTLREVLALFEEASGRSLPVRWGGRPYRPREVMRPWDGGTPPPGWEPKIPLEEGLRRILDAT